MLFSVYCDPQFQEIENKYFNLSYYKFIENNSNFVTKIKQFIKFFYKIVTDLPHPKDGTKKDEKIKIC